MAIVISLKSQCLYCQRTDQKFSVVLSAAVFANPGVVFFYCAVQHHPEIP